MEHNDIQDNNRNNDQIMYQELSDGRFTVTHSINGVLVRSWANKESNFYRKCISVSSVILPNSQEKDEKKDVQDIEWKKNDEETKEG